MFTKLLYFFYLAPPIILLLRWDGLNFLPILISMFVVLISAHGIIKNGLYSVSFFTVICVFNYFFLGIIPIFTYIFNIDFWGAGSFLPNDYILTSLVILVSIFTFNICYKFYNKNNENSKNYFFIFKSMPKYSENRFTGVILISISFAIFLYIYYVNEFDVINVFTRGKLGDQTNLRELSQINYLFLNFFLVPILSINLFLYSFSKKRSNLVILFLASLLILGAPPTSVPRIMAITLYLPLIILYFSIFFKKHIFPLILLIGLFFVFPFLDLFRYGSSKFTNFSLSNMLISSFTAGHFDSYQSLMILIKDGTITFGKQLLGVFFFFIPREFWENKPIGSGQLIAEKLNLKFTNISSNFLAEGFINFGFPGVLLFVILLAVFCGSIDFRMQCSKLDKTPRFFAFYLFLLPLIFYMLRGDLMSAFSYIISILTAIIIIDKIIKLFR